MNLVFICHISVKDLTLLVMGCSRTSKSWGRAIITTGLKKIIFFTHINVFYLRNGCKQGAVLSAIAYCVYVNGLFEELHKNRSGCWVGGSFLGLLGYSDDNFLLAPSREALQSMLYICEKYANEHGLKFSTDLEPKKS